MTVAVAVAGAGALVLVLVLVVRVTVLQKNGTSPETSKSIHRNVPTCESNRHRKERTLLKAPTCYYAKAHLKENKSHLSHRALQCS